jgi:type II secretory pathway pseudopilin PulG
MTTPSTQPRGGRQSGITMIELLTAMSIASLLAVMMLTTWFALSDSYSFSSNSNKARDKARFAIGRMEREIRDAENVSTVSEVAVVRARPWSILIYTTFNRADNDLASTAPLLVMYRLYSDGELWRFHDANRNGSIAGVDTTFEPWPGVNYNLNEQSNGEGGQLLTDGVVNAQRPSTSDPTPLFRYSYFATDGSTTWSHLVTGTSNRFLIKSVAIHLLVDVNPNHAPVYTDLQTTAQLRNQR